MLNTINIALFGGTQTVTLDPTKQLLLALNTWALSAASDRLDSGVRFNVYQCHIRADSQLNERGFDLCFLLGQQGHPESPELTKAEDEIRHALHDSGLDYQVLYGSSKEQLAAIVNAVASLLKTGQPANSSTRPVCEDSRDVDRKAGRSWVHTCERCSDPHSERSLLSSLVALRAGSASAI